MDIFHYFPLCNNEIILQFSFHFPHCCFTGVRQGGMDQLLLHVHNVDTRPLLNYSLGMLPLIVYSVGVSHSMTCNIQFCYRNLRRFMSALLRDPRLPPVRSQCDQWRSDLATIMLKVEWWPHNSVHRWQTSVFMQRQTWISEYTQICETKIKFICSHWQTMGLRPRVCLRKIICEAWQLLRELWEYPWKPP